MNYGMIILKRVCCFYNRKTLTTAAKSVSFCKTALRVANNFSAQNFVLIMNLINYCNNFNKRGRRRGINYSKTRSFLKNKNFDTAQTIKRQTGRFQNPYYQNKNLSNNKRNNRFDLQAER